MITREEESRPGSPLAKRQFEFAVVSAGALPALIPSVLASLLLGSGLLVAADVTNSPAKPDRPLFYFHEVDPTVPWSMHIVKIDRSHPELRFCTTLGDGQILGMSTVPEQLRSLPSELGQPMAAINGDYYDKSKEYAGCPRDLQIHLGEVVSNPAGHNCFWVNAEGNPRMTNVASRFRVVWPDGKQTPMGLNRQRTNTAAMLYSVVIGISTRTSGGREVRAGARRIKPLASATRRSYLRGPRPLRPRCREHRPRA